MELSIMIGLVLLVVIFLGVQLLWIRRIDHDRRTVAETETGTAEQRKILHEENLELREKKTRLGTSLHGRQERGSDLRPRLEASEQARIALNDEKVRLLEQVAQISTTMEQQTQHHQEKMVMLEGAKEKLSESFKALAGEIFESKQKTFKHQSEEQLSQLLKPLGERLKDFQNRVETAYSEESKERFSLRNELKHLRDLNARMSQEAINLTNALKGESKTQGTWGEIVLERVLEKSGLVKGREYEVQLSLKSDEGRRYQPDVVVHLPEGKDIIVDSKVSLTAYERFCSAEDEAEQMLQAAAHVQSLRQHVKQLGEKDYQNLMGVRSLDFVLMFVPIEAAFSMALQSDDGLFGDAFDQNIIIVTPSTLLVTLRTIQNIWRYEHQSANAQEIANKAGSLYDKLVGFVGDLELVGARLASAQNAYDDAHKKLSSGRGNLLRRAESMRALGVSASKKLPKHLIEEAATDASSLLDSAEDEVTIN